MAEAAGDWDLPPHKWSVNRDNNIPEHSPPRHEASHPSLCQQLLATFMPTRNIPNLQKETDQAVVTGHRKLVGSFQISWTISVRWSGATLTDVPPLSHPTLGLWGGIHSNSRCLWNGNLGHENFENYSQSHLVPALALTDLSQSAGEDSVVSLKTRQLMVDVINVSSSDDGTCIHISQSLNSWQWPLTLVICTALTSG